MILPTLVEQLLVFLYGEHPAQWRNGNALIDMNFQRSRWIANRWIDSTRELTLSTQCMWEDIVVRVHIELQAMLMFSGRQNMTYIFFSFEF